MQRKALFAGVTLFMMFLLVGASPVVAKSPVPSQAELDVQLTYFSPYNSEYKLADPLITGNTVDLMFLEALRSSTKLVLGKSVWEGNFGTVVNNAEYSVTLGNATWNTATSDGMTVNTEATSNGPETLVTFKATTNASAVAQYAQALSYFNYDGNDDGDYSDTADKTYLPHDENVWILVNNEMTTDGTDAQTYSTVEVALQTTTSTDYTITIKYWYTSGDSGWDFTTSNGATLEFFDCSGVPIVTVLPVADILDADSESVNVIGSDYMKQYLYEDVASKYVQNELKNFAYFSSMPAFTDATDGNTDWDFDGSDEYFTGIDQTDYLFTVLTQDTTDTYDNDQELLLDHSGSITTIVKARYLYFTGAMAVYPYPYSFRSDVVETGKYLTYESFSFDTREIHSLTAMSNVLSVSTWKLNLTLEDSIYWDTDHYENNLVKFTDEQGIDQTESIRSVFTTTTDDSEVQYDSTNPSSTTGALQTFALQSYTSVSYGQVDVTTTTTTTTPTGGTASSSGVLDPMIGFILLAAVFVVSALYLKYRS